MSGSRAKFMPGSYIPKGRRKSKKSGMFGIPVRYRPELTKQVRAEDEQTGQAKVRDKKKDASCQAANTATKLRNSRITRLLLEAKIGKIGKDKPAVAKALRREVNRRLVAENKVREEQKLRENTQRLVERRKLRLAKMLREIRKKRRGK